MFILSVESGPFFYEMGYESSLFDRCYDTIVATTYALIMHIMSRQRS
jgi:hypothetical protein